MAAKIETDGGAISLFRDRGITCTPLGSDLVSRIADREHRRYDRTQDQTVEVQMRPIIAARVWPTRTHAFLVAAALLLPVQAWAGDERGGLGDQVRGNYGYTKYTNYTAAQDPLITPCQSCYSGGTNEQNLSAYNVPNVRICDSCTDAGRGGRLQLP
jgi:hypothetical protein